MTTFAWPTLTARAIRWPYQTSWITYQKALAANHSSAIGLARKHASEHSYETVDPVRHAIGAGSNRSALVFETKPRHYVDYDELFRDLVSYCDGTDRQTSVHDHSSWILGLGTSPYQPNRLCMRCIRHGYQSPIHWNRLLSTCPLCDGEIRAECPTCGRPFRIDRGYSTRYICPQCKWRFPAYRELRSSVPWKDICRYHEQFQRFVGRCNNVLVGARHDPLGGALYSRNRVELGPKDCRPALARVATITGYGSFARSSFGLTKTDQPRNANIQRVVARWSNTKDVMKCRERWSPIENQLVARLRAMNPRCALTEIAGDSRTIFPRNDHCAVCRAIIFCRTSLSFDSYSFSSSRALCRARSIRTFIEELSSEPGRFILESREREAGNYTASVDEITRDEIYAYFIFALATYKWACWRFVRGEHSFYQDCKLLVLTPLRKKGLLPFRAPVFFRSNTPLNFDVLRQYPDPQILAISELEDSDCIPPVHRSDLGRTLSLFGTQHKEAPIHTRYSGTPYESPDHRTLPDIEWSRRR